MSKIGGRMWNPMLRGYIDAKWPFKPMKFRELSEHPMAWTHIALDHITAAVESGELDSETWPEQLFATEGDFHDFLSSLSGYDECFRIVDRWWFALAQLAEHDGDEEGFIHTQDIADEIENVYQELLTRRAEAAKPKKAKRKAVAA